MLQIKYYMRQAQIAQLVEQRTENPRVTGSIPVPGITKKQTAFFEKIRERSLCLIISFILPSHIPYGYLPY